MSSHPLSEPPVPYQSISNCAPAQAVAGLGVPAVLIQHIISTLSPGAQLTVQKSAPWFVVEVGSTLRVYMPS